MHSAAISESANYESDSAATEIQPPNDANKQFPQDAGDDDDVVAGVTTYGPWDSVLTSCFPD